MNLSIGRIVSVVKNHKKKFGVLAFAVVLIGAIIGVGHVVNEAKTKKELELHRLEQERLKHDQQAAFDLFLDGYKSLYEFYPLVKSDDPAYFAVLAKESAPYRVTDQWKAINASNRRKASYILEDINDMRLVCGLDTICSEQATDFYRLLERSIETYVGGIDAWENNSPYDGNTLMSESSDLLEETILEGDLVYDFFWTSLSEEQFDMYFSIASTAYNEASDRHAEILGYCSSISQKYEEYARYQSACVNDDLYGWIALNSHNSLVTEQPYKVTGTTSGNVRSITVTTEHWEGGGWVEKDTYTLKDFSSGDKSFYYRLAEKYNNLFPGSNRYDFVATMTDGSVKTAQTTLTFFDYDFE